MIGGDDLRKDNAVMQMFYFMNVIWEDADLRYKGVLLKFCVNVFSIYAALQKTQRNAMKTTEHRHINVLRWDLILVQLNSLKVVPN